jgi:hypothetical protein
MPLSKTSIIAIAVSVGVVIIGLGVGLGIGLGLSASSNNTSNKPPTISPPPTINPENTGGVDKLGVTSLSSSDSDNNSRLLRRRQRDLSTTSTSPTDPRSRTSYSFAVLDSLQLKVVSVKLNHPTHSMVWTAPHGGQIVEVGHANTIPINANITIFPGNYTEPQIDFQSEYTVKAYCITQNSSSTGSAKLVYTTATGVKRLNYTGDGMTLPSDYAPYYYPFSYVTTSKSKNDSTNTFGERTKTTVTVQANTTNQLLVLIDTSFNVACYDGLQPTINGDGAESPFNWGSASDFFPASDPAFGLAYLPVFIYLGPIRAGQPTGKTFTSSARRASIDQPGSSFDLGQPDNIGTQIHTVAFAPDGSAFQMRTRGFDHGDIAQFTFGLVGGAAGSSISGENGDGGVSTDGLPCSSITRNCRDMGDRHFNFTQQPIGVLTKAYVSDGRDCYNIADLTHFPKIGDDGVPTTSATPRNAACSLLTKEIWLKQIARG